MASRIGNQLTRQMSSSAHEASTGLWRKLSFFIALPGVGIAWINSYLAAQAPDHDKPPEFVAYEHLRLRTKRFPWGDGNHSLFHSHMNALPEGYDEEGHH